MYATIHVAVMLLVMTMNGFVIISILMGLTLGYTMHAAEKTESDLPVNCCEH